MPPNKPATESAPKRLPHAGSHVPNAFIGILLGLSTAYLNINARKKAMFYLVWIALLSIVASFYDFDTEHSYFTQKHNILNQFGVKIGWFWTLITVGPFVWFVGRACHPDKDRVFKDIFRLLVATGMWYFTIQVFHRVLYATSRCDKSVMLSRTACSEQGGHWILGIDISGHCFLMVYSILIICEESAAFRKFVSVGRDKPEGPLVNGTFLAMAVLHLFWDLQLVISTLYYHIMFDKVAGVAFAAGCWYVTYRGIYKQGLLPRPIGADDSDKRKASIPAKKRPHVH